MSQWHVQPSELDYMPFFRIQWMFEDFKEMIEQTTEGTDNVNLDKETKNMMNKAKSNMFGSSNFNLKNMFNNIKMPKL